MAAPKDVDPYESPLHFFASELRRHRLRMGWTQDQLGRKVNYSDDTISKIETGEARPSIELGRKCDEVFGTHGVMERLAEMVHKTAAFPSWFRKWPEEVEPEAHTLRSWQPLVIDGLLQTPDYARELIKMHPGMAEERVEELVAARMERKKILDRGDPPVLWFVMDERVLHSQTGSPKIMRDQLRALIETSYHTHASIQVVSLSVGTHIGNVGAFAIASMNGEPDVVYLESARAGHVTDRPEDVQEIMNIWEAVRGEALSPRASLDLISKVMEQWT